jgi:predicted lipid-binding transport protein (Tim44 family)
MSLIDVIIIGILLVVVISRFTGFKLPKDPRNSAARKADFQKLFPTFTPPTPQENKPAQSQRKQASTPSLAELKNLEGIDQIKALDHNFNTDKFLTGAQKAYAYFYQCWNTRNEPALDDLCGPTLLQKVTQMWATSPTTITLESEPTATIRHARVNGRTAIIAVVMEAQQREDGANPRPVKAEWVFARALNNPDPNWELQDIIAQPDA